MEEMNILMNASLGGGNARPHPVMQLERRLWPPASEHGEREGDGQLATDDDGDPNAVAGVEGRHPQDARGRGQNERGPGGVEQVIGVVFACVPSAHEGGATDVAGDDEIQWLALAQKPRHPVLLGPAAALGPDGQPLLGLCDFLDPALARGPQRQPARWFLWSGPVEPDGQDAKAHAGQKNQANGNGTLGHKQRPAGEPRQEPLGLGDHEQAHAGQGRGLTHQHQRGDHAQRHGGFETARNSPLTLLNPRKLSRSQIVQY
jgi:hypothetical protein